MQVGAGLRVGELGIGEAGEGGLADETAGLEGGGARRHVVCERLEGLDFAAVGGEKIGEARDVETGGELMRAMPVARCGDDVGDGLQALAALMKALKIISRGAVDEEDVRLGAERDVIESAVISGHAQLEERVVKPDLIFERGEVALLLAGDGGGDGVERVEAEIAVAGAVVKEGGVEDVLGRDVVLEAKQIVASPFLRSVGAGGLLFDDGERVLNADGIGEPEAAAKNGAGESEAGIPVAEVDAFLNVDAGSGIGGAEAPLVVAVGSFEAENVCAGMRVAGAEAAGLDFGGASGVDIEASGESAVGRIAEIEAVEEILRFAGTRAGNVEIALVVLGDFGEGDEAFGEDVRVGDGNIANGAGRQGIALGGVLWIDLVGGSGDLDLLVNFFRVIESESELVVAGLEGEGAIGDEEKAFLADFELVIASGEIAKSETAGFVGFGAEDVAGGIFEFDLNGGERNAVFVDDDAGAVGEVGRARFERGK